MSSMNDFDGSGALVDTPLRPWPPTPDETYMALFSHHQHQMDEVMARIVYLSEELDKLKRIVDGNRTGEWPW